MNDIKSAIEELLFHRNSCYVVQITDKTCNIAISALERQLELENLGFTFNSLIEAREKQTPKKPKYYAETEEDYAHAKCPTCKDVLGIAPLLFKNNCCEECGQKLDWSVGG